MFEFWNYILVHDIYILVHDIYTQSFTVYVTELFVHSVPFKRRLSETSLIQPTAEKSCDQ